MAKKNNTRTLLILFLVLVGVFALLQIRNRKMESTLDTHLINVDTAKVTRILLYPQEAHGSELLFTKGSNGWQVRQGEREAPVEAGSVKNILTEIEAIQPKRLVSVSDTAWNQYSVSDSTATRVVVMEGKKKTLDLYVGRFKVDNTSQQYGGYQGGIKGSSYIRLGNSKEVYEVEGFLAISFNQGFDTWRDHLFVHTTQQDIRKFTFTYPADTGFVVEKKDTLWMSDGVPADSAAIAGYLAGWSFRRYTNFVDHPNLSDNPDYRITAEGINMPPVVLEAYRDPVNHFIMHSSLNPETWFADKDSTIFKTFFVPKNTLVGNTH